MKNHKVDGLNKEMDRRAFLGRTTKLATAAIGLSFVGSLASLPVGAVSSVSVEKAHGVKPQLVFPVISDVHIKSNNSLNLEKFVTTLKQLKEVAPQQNAFIVWGI